jgi:beta-galactosidase
MRWYGLAALLMGLFAGVAAAESGAGAARQVENFDAGWRFVQADVEGGERVNMPDGGWQRVELPHDWAITAPFLESNPAGGAGAFATYDVGWYRKEFSLPLSARGRKAFVEFDGVMANSDVWVNGMHLGHRPYGYVSFAYELTPYLHYGPKALNVLAVRADDSKQPASRWYEGAGIYRHVRLVVVNPVHIAQWGAFVSTPHVSADASEVRVQTEVRNEASAEARVHLAVSILDASGRTVAAGSSRDVTIGAGVTSASEVSVNVPRPALWSIESPSLYHAVVRVVSGRRTLDEESVSFGIRDAHFEAATGFWLNGRNIKIKGVALHSDAGSLGMAAPLAAWEHRLVAMKRMGANAIRTAHNPVAPEFLDLCDRMGFLVMDEMFDQWTVAKNPYDYHLYFREWHLADTRDTVRRDRKHPSIILYSAGNEIHDTPNAELAKSILGPLVAEFHQADPTRPVTQALFRPNASHDYQDGLADMLDVVGQNYRENEILAAHAEKPSRKIIGTENGHSRESWIALRDHPEYAGQFLWSGTDYLGESRHWPIIGNASGLYDRTDRPKPDGLERESWWSEQPVVHIARRVAPTQKAPTDPGYEAVQYRPAQVVFADWTPADGSPHTEHVEVYSNCESVELFLNGRSLGSLPLNRDAAPRRWDVPFEAGTLRAVATNGGKVVASEDLRTAGKPDHLLLKVESSRFTPAWDDVAYVRALVVDRNGVEVPDADTLFTFAAAGPGKVLTTDNGDNSDHTGFDRPDRHAYHGEAIAILRATANSGKVTVTVTGEGLRPASVELHIDGRR